MAKQPDTRLEESSVATSPPPVTGPVRTFTDREARYKPLTPEEIKNIDWESDEYPLKRLSGPQATQVINALDDSDRLELIVHEDKRMSIVEAARVRLRTTANDRKRALASMTFGRYYVEYGGKSGTFKARDEREAWALFNDASPQTSHSPRVPGRRITKVESLPPEIPLAPGPVLPSTGGPLSQFRVTASGHENQYSATDEANALSQFNSERKTYLKIGDPDVKVEKVSATPPHVPVQ